MFSTYKDFLVTPGRRIGLNCNFLQVFVDTAMHDITRRLGRFIELPADEESCYCKISYPVNMFLPYLFKILVQ
jgi:hypothetical protein